MALPSKLTILFGSSIAFVLLIATGDLVLNSGGSATSPSSKFELKEEALALYESKANKGDEEAAFALAQHYAMFSNDLKRADFWYSVAAIRGHKLAKIFYGDALLRGDDGNLDKVRSLADDISTYDPESAKSIRERVSERTHR